MLKPALHLWLRWLTVCGCAALAVGLSAADRLAGLAFTDGKARSDSELTHHGVLAYYFCAH